MCYTGTQLPSPNWGTAPEFSANICCGQTAGWSKMPLGMDVCLGPVLDGDPAPVPKGAQPPIFGPCLLWPNGWMDEDATGYRSRPCPRLHCVRRGVGSGDPSCSFAREKGTCSSPRLFSAHVYCDYSRPSQLLLSSCTNGHPKIFIDIDNDMVK